MHNQRNLLFALLCIPLLCSAQKQHVAFAYDASGNCISRTIVLDSSKKAKQSVATSVCGFTDVIGTLGVLIYPNPVAENLTIAVKGELSAPSSYFLYDSTGKKLANGDLTEEKNTIDMTACPKGTYILNISIGNESITWKVLKK